MHAIKLKAVIDASHRLQLDLPADTPIGEAEVIVLVGAAAPPRAADAANPVSPGQSLREFFEELDRRPRARLSAEEVEQWIEAERNSWD